MSNMQELEVAAIRERGWRDVAETGDPAYRVLLASVRCRGVLEPLVVRAHPEGGYQVVSGARRLQAAREAGCTTVPAVVRDRGEAEALVGGAWAALTRSGVSEDEADRVRGQLLAAGMSEADAVLLTGTLPRTGPGVELTGRAAPVETRAPAWAWGRRGSRRRG